MLGALYGKIINLRNSLYANGVFAAHSLGAPTVSIGNITVGGTGKTPLVAYLAQQLIGKNIRVAVLSRGYGRRNPKSRVLVADGVNVLADAHTAGDEPFELAHRLRGKAVVIADADRAAAAQWARANFDIGAFVLDDAFQHQRARRDLNLVVIDATNPFGNRKMLPFGILREPPENLKRADAFVISRANLIGETMLDALKAELSGYAHRPIFTAGGEVLRIVPLAAFGAEPEAAGAITGTAAVAEFFAAHSAAAFCALGNPQNFFAQLKRETAQLAHIETFPDHHFYTRRDVSAVETRAAAHGAQVLLTTAKDAGKLVALPFSMPCFVVETSLAFADAARFDALVERIFDRSANAKTK